MVPRVFRPYGEEVAFFIGRDIMDKDATEHLRKMKRISSCDLKQEELEEVLLYNEKKELLYKDDKVYISDGKCLKDLLRVIKIKEPLSLQYVSTPILVPRIYAEKIKILFCNI